MWVRVWVRAWIFGLSYVAFSEAPHQGFSPGTPVSSPPSSVNGLANGINNSSLESGTVVVLLPDAWCFRVSARTSLPGVCMLWLGEVTNLICNFPSQRDMTCNSLSECVPTCWPPCWARVKASAFRAADLGFDSRLCWDFFGSNHTSDVEIGTPVATLPGAWCYGVSAGTDCPGVSILWLGERKSLIATSNSL